MKVGISSMEHLTLQATRKGIDNDDKNTPFVESRTQELLTFYEHYKNSKEYKIFRSPYAQTIALKKNDTGFTHGVDVEEFKVLTINSHYKPPNYLKKHHDKAISLFKNLNKIRKNKQDIWENNSSVRIVEWDRDKKVISIQPATYFNQIGTNLTMDWASGVLGGNPASTIRNNIESHKNGMLPNLKTSILANTLGLAVVLVNTKTKEVLIPIRGSAQAVMAEGKGKFHCSASGVFELDNFPTKGETVTFDIFIKGMQKEIEEEIGLQKDSYELTPLAFSRELARGGKPQLFFIAKTNIEIEKIKSSMINATDSWEFMNANNLPSNSPLKKYLNTPLEAPQELFTYEGWMALKIALAYLYNENPPF